MRFKVRTAPDNGSGAPGTWSNWNGPGSTNIESYKYDVDADYQRSSKIKVSSGVAKLYKGLAEYAYSESIYIDNTGGTAKTNEVVSFQIPTENSSFWSHIQTGCADVRFHDGTQELSYYLASLDYPNKQARFNVKVPSIAANSVKTIYMVFGSPQAVTASTDSLVNIPTTGLVGYYKFDEGIGTTTADSSSYANTGSLFGATTPQWSTAGKYGNCIRFDGIDDYVRIYNIAELKQEWTIGFWATAESEPTPENSWQVVINPPSQRPFIALHPNSQMMFTNRNAYNNGCINCRRVYCFPKRDDKWRHFAVTSNQLGSRTFANGVKKCDDRSINYVSQSIPSQSWDIGRWYGANSGQYKGRIDEVVMYNRALTDIEIRDLYRGVSATWQNKVTFGAVVQNGDCANLVGWLQKIPITITNTSSGPKTNAIVRIDLNKWQEFWSHVKSDGADIRVVDSDNSTVLPYYLLDFNYANKLGTVVTQVPLIPSSSSKTIYLYYANSSATDTSNSAFSLQFSAGFDYQEAAGSCANLSGWLYKSSITVRNNTGADVTNAIVNINILDQWSGFWQHVKSDGSDIRIVDTDGATVLSYYLDYFDNTAKNAGVLTKISSIANGASKIIWLYYGKATATSASSGTFMPISQTLGAPTEATGNSTNLTTWLYKMPITITNNTASALTNKAVNISMDPTWASFWAHVKSDGADVRFVDTDNTTTFSYNLQYFNGTNAVAAADVTIPAFPASSSKTIYLYYGYSFGYSNSISTNKAYDVGGLSTIDPASFKEGGGLLPVVNDYVSLQNDNNSWDCYLMRDYQYPRTIGLAFQCKINAHSTDMMVGWKNNSSNLSYSGLVYGIYFASGTFYIYEDGSNKALVGTYDVDAWYEIKIIQKIQGATYWIRSYGTVTWTLLYNSDYSTEGYLKPFISHYPMAATTDTDNWKVFKDMPSDTLCVTDGVISGAANTFELPNYYTDNPVIQPVNGVFYNSSNMASFVEVANKPSGSDIKYQISADGWNWYWYTAGAWTKVTGGYAQTNSAAEVNTYLGAFQTMFPTGSFYYRAYFHSDTGAVTAELDQIDVALTSAETFYTEPNGSQLINVENSNVSADQWIQYKAILYSDGQNTPLVNDVTLTYTDAWINVTSPAGGEGWLVGSTQNITWTSQGIDATATNVKIEYSPDNEASWKSVVGNTPNNGSYTWTLPNDAGRYSKVRITSISFPTVIGKSAAPFRIMGIRVDAPNGGEIWELGKTHNVTWTSRGTVSNNLNIMYSIDGGATWSGTVATATADDGIQAWTLPTNLNQTSDNTKVSITDGSNQEITDPSDNVFAIVPNPAITLDSPAGGEQWTIGSVHNINWHTNSQQFASQFIIEWSTDDFNTVINSIATVNSGAPANPLTPNTDLTCSYAWTVADNFQPSAKIRVREASVPASRDTQTAVSGKSNEFSIVNPIITITRPNGGEVWVKGETENITWTSVGTVSNNLKLEYSINGGITWPYTISGFDGVNDGSFTWTVPNSISNQVRVQITDLNRPVVKDSSNANFEIINYPRVVITSPNGGESLTIGQPYTITWNVNGHITNNDVKIEYSKDNFVADINTVTPSTTNTGSYLWSSVPSDGSITVKIRVTALTDPLITDTSDAYCTICSAGVTVIAPNGAEQWEVGKVHTLRWVSGIGVNAASDIVLQYSTDGGGTWISPAIATGQLKTSTYSWVVPNAVSDLVKLRAYSFGQPALTDDSNANFSIVPVPVMTVTSPASPNGTNSWKVGTSHAITWNNVGNLYTQVDLYYSRDGGTNWIAIALAVANSGTYTWDSIPDTVCNNAKVKVIESGVPVRDTLTKVQGISAIFNIIEPTITVVSPNGGQFWVANEQEYITWNPDGWISNDLKMEYSKNNFVSDLHLIYSGLVPSTGMVPGSLYTRKITIDNTANSTALTNYQVKLIINTQALIGAGKMRTDGNDIRFADSSQPLSYYLVSSTLNTTTTEIWVKIPSVAASSTKDIFMYYGNPTSKPGLNYDNTFTKDFGSDDTLLALYHFDEGSGTVANDSSIQGNTATLVGNTTWYSADGGRWGDRDIQFATGSCLVFDGVNSYVDSAVITPGTSLTVEAWVYLPELPATGTVMNIMGKNNGAGNRSYSLWIGPEGMPHFSIYNSSDVAQTGLGSAMATNTRNHIVGVWDGSNVKVYVNNVPGAAVAATSIHSSTTTVTFGKIKASGSEGYFKGRLDEIRIYNRALPADEIQAHYERRKYINPPPTVSTAAEIPINSYYWTIPNDVSDSVKVRITDNNRTQVSDVSDGYFSIIPQPAVTITKPATGETLIINSTYQIKWRVDGHITGHNVKISYTKDDGTTLHSIADSVPNNGTFTWLSVVDDASTTVKIVIQDLETGYGYVNNMSAGNFKIQGALAITSPVLHDQWAGGYSYPITWNTTGTINQVKLEYSNNGFVSSNIIGTPPIDNTGANKGMYTWDVPRDVSASTSVRISQYDNADVTATSSNFTITGFTLTASQVTGRLIFFRSGIQRM